MIIPIDSSSSLEARQSNGGCDGYFHDGRCYPSGWYYWGRWVLAAIVIFFFIALFVAWSCISTRRRRRAGLRPRYGTGWVPGYYANNNNAPAPPPEQQYQQNNNGGWFGGWANKQNQPPPPQYTPGAMGNQYTGQTFNSNEGYYGHHANDVPLQQPTGSYYPRGGDQVYNEPPRSPPPAAKN